jgi:hypothetical protein
MLLKENKMSISHEEVMSKLSPERRARIEARTQELIKEEMTLRDVRQVQHLTQQCVEDGVSGGYAALDDEQLR